MLKDDDTTKRIPDSYTPAIEYQPAPIQSYEPYTYYYAHNPEPTPPQVIYNSVNSNDNAIYRYDPISTSLVYIL